MNTFIAGHQHHGGVSGEEAHTLLAEVWSLTARSLSRALSTARPSLPSGQGTFAARVAALPTTVSARDVTRLAAYRSAPAVWRSEITACCSERVPPVRSLLWAVLETRWVKASPRWHYRRGGQAYEVSAEDAWEAVTAWLTCDLQLARTVLACTPLAHAPQSASQLVAFSVRFALTDSLGFRGALDSTLARQLSWPAAGGLLESTLPSVPSLGCLDAPDHWPDAGRLNHWLAQLQAAFEAQFPVLGVSLGRNRAAQAMSLYLDGMAQCAEAGQEVDSGWRRLRLPRGYVKSVVCPALGLPEHQERLLRRAWEASLAQVRQQNARAEIAV
jgi:hypothetical protein